MADILVYFAFALLIAASFLLGSLLLFLLLRLLRTQTTFLSATRIFMLFTVASILVVVISLASRNDLLTTLASAASLILFVILLRKSYQLPIWKGVVIVFVHGIAFYIIAAALLVLPFKEFVSEPFVVEGASMEPAFQSGDYLVLEKITSSYEKGDVVVTFEEPEGIYFLRRIQGVSGDEFVMGNERGILGESEYFVQADDPEFARPRVVPSSSIVGSLLIELPFKYSRE